MGNQECPNRLSIKGRFHGTTSVRTVPSLLRTRVLRPIILAILFASLVAASKDVAVVWRCHSKNGLSSWTWYCPPAISSVTYQHFVDSVFKRLVFNGRCQGITSSTKDISGDLPCLLVGEEEEPNTDA